MRMLLSGSPKRRSTLVTLSLHRFLTLSKNSFAVSIQCLLEYVLRSYSVVDYIIILLL